MIYYARIRGDSCLGAATSSFVYSCFSSFVGNISVGVLIYIRFLLTETDEKFGHCFIVDNELFFEVESSTCCTGSYDALYVLSSFLGGTHVH
jgi:hypothetical protein